MRIRVGNDIRIIIKLYSDDKQINFQSVSAFLYNTTQERIRKEKEEKINRFIGRFPKEPFSNIYSPTEYNINCIGNHYHVKPFVKVYNGFGVKPDWKDIYGCHVPPTSRRVEVFFREKKNEIELRFPACWQLGEGDYSITVIGEVFDPGFNDNNLRTIVYDYKDVFTLVDKSYGADEFDGNIYVNFEEGEEPNPENPDPENPDPENPDPVLNPINTDYKAFQYDGQWYLLDGDNLIYIEILDGDTEEYLYTGLPLFAESDREGYITIFTDGEGHMAARNQIEAGLFNYEEFASQFGLSVDTLNWDNDILPMQDVEIIEAPELVDNTPYITLFGFIKDYLGLVQYENVTHYQSVNTQYSGGEAKSGYLFEIPSSFATNHDRIGITIRTDDPNSIKYPIKLQFFRDLQQDGSYTPTMPVTVLSSPNLTLPYEFPQSIVQLIANGEITGVDIYGVTVYSEYPQVAEGYDPPFSYDPRDIQLFYIEQEELPRDIIKTFAAQFSDGSARPIKSNTYYWYKQVSPEDANTSETISINIGYDSQLDRFITVKSVQPTYFIGVNYNSYTNGNLNLSQDTIMSISKNDNNNVVESVINSDVIQYSKLGDIAKNQIGDGIIYLNRQFPPANPNNNQQ